MAIFTAISFWASSSLAFMGSGGISFLGLSPAATSAIFSIGRSVAWSLAAQALNRQQMPRQKVQANISQTDAARVRAYGRVLLGGVRTFFEADDGQLHQIAVVHHGRTGALLSVWIDGEKVATGATPAPADGGGRVNRYLTVCYRDGSHDGGNYAGVLNTGDAANDLDWKDLGQMFPSLWTPAHRLAGQATFYSIFGDPADEDFAKFFPKGPNTIVQVEVQGAMVRNMAGSLVYSDNCGLAARDYLTHPDGWRIPESALDTASFSAFTALCNEPVALKAGGTEPRYRIGGTYSLDDAPKDVMARILSSCDGQIYQTAEGKVGILGGRWSEPDVTISADDILSYSVDDGFDPFTDFNVLRGSFLSPDHSYQMTEVPARRDAADLVTQGERSEQIDIDMCPSGTQMQRLQKILWAKRRRALSGTITTNLVGLKARFPKGDGVHTIRVVAPEFQIDDVFEVTSHRFSIPDGWCEIGIASLSSPYGWNAATEEQPLPPTPDQAGKPARTLPSPTGASLTQVPVRVSGDVFGGRLRLTVAPTTRADLTVQAQVARGDVLPDNAVALWTEMGGDRFTAETSILENEQPYTVRYRWRRGGAWKKAGTVTIVANPNVPAAPTGFARAGSAGVSLKWTNPVDNFWKARIFRGVTASFADASYVKDVTGLAGQDATATDSPGAGVWRYWVVALNGSSVASLPTGPISITI